MDLKLGDTPETTDSSEVQSTQEQGVIHHDSGNKKKIGVLRKLLEVQQNFTCLQVRRAFRSERNRAVHKESWEDAEEMRKALQ